ncbi:MAG: META domain-containing protein [Bacteroidia bacterium]|nr:META domain-containing protein [Bacteroidia bacterium]
MKKILLALVVAAALFFSIESCMQNGSTRQDVVSIDGTWIVVSVLGDIIDDPSLMPVITIEDNSQVQGALPCNSMHAKVKLFPSGKGTVHFDSIGTTKRLCRNMSVENAFLEVLSKIEKYEVESFSGNAAELLVDFQDKNGKSLVEAKKMGDNTTSEAISVLHGEWVIYALGADTIIGQITLPFIVDPASESISGHTGCNSFGGTISLHGAHGVTFPSIAATQALGDNEQNSRDSLIISALKNTTAWSEDTEGRVKFSDSLGHTLFVVER